MNAPADLPLTVVRGSTFQRSWRYLREDDAGARTPVDLTGWAGKLQVRDRDGRPLVKLDTAGGAQGTLQLDADGWIIAMVPASVTGAIDAATARWALELTDPQGVEDTLLAGVVTLPVGVT